MRSATVPLREAETETEGEIFEESIGGKHIVMRDRTEKDSERAN